MKLKSNVIISVIVVISFLLGGRTTLKAQGIFGNDNNEKVTDIKPGGGSLFRADPPGGWGSGDDDDDGDPERPPEPDGDDDTEPIGEGVLILSLLAGGYAMAKRNVRKKHES